MLQGLQCAPSAAPTYRSVVPISVRLESISPFRGRPTHPSEAQKAGLRYEAAVKKALLMADSWKRGQWLSYEEAQHRGRSWCQPDAFDVDNERVRIVEIKRRWCVEIAEKLRTVYVPVLDVVFPCRRMDLYCVCSSFDPAVPGSNEAYFVSSLAEAPPTGRIGVIVWKGVKGAKTLRPYSGLIAGG